MDMVDLSNTVSTLLMYANSDSQNWREQANTAIHAYPAYRQGDAKARGDLAKEFAKVKPDTKRGNAIRDMIALP